MNNPIHNNEDYEMALAKAESLWGADQGTLAGDELDVLLVLIEAYENENQIMPPSDSGS